MSEMLQKRPDLLLKTRGEEVGVVTEAFDWFPMGRSRPGLIKAPLQPFVSSSPAPRPAHHVADPLKRTITTATDRATSYQL